ncbi:MAG: YdcF family protein [Verrucomicrobiota bacterium]
MLTAEDGGRRTEDGGQESEDRSQRTVVRKWPRRLVLWSCGLVVLLAAICFVFRAPLLRSAATAWVVNDPPGKADAIVLLGGGIQFRPFEAARLYQEGVAPRILIMNSELQETDREELTISWQEMARRILVRKGVPASAVQVAGKDLTSTYDEACAVRDWCKTSQARVLLIPTGPFHTRRVNWVFGKVLRNSGVQIRVLALPSEHFPDWWRHEESLIDFNNEVVKYGMYRWRY